MTDALIGWTGRPRPAIPGIDQDTYNDIYDILRNPTGFAVDGARARLMRALGRERAREVWAEIEADLKRDVEAEEAEA